MGIRRKIFDIISSKAFDWAIAIIITANIVTLALPYDDAPASFMNTLSIFNYIFTSLFVLEMILKIIGLDFRRYWSSGWNKFDAFVVMTSLIDIALNLFASGIPKSLNYIPQVAKCFRILRCFKLLRRFKGLMKILNVLYLSLPGVMTAFSLLFLSFFIFAILANHLFQNTEAGYYGTLDQVTNFENFCNSFMTLWRASTGENYYLIMYDLMYPTTCLVEGGCG